MQVVSQCSVIIGQ